MSFSFRAAEFDSETCEPTGRFEYYQASTIHEAVESVLYARQLANGGAEVGPTGRVVHVGGRSWVVLDGGRDA